MNKLLGSLLLLGLTTAPAIAKNILDELTVVVRLIRLSLSFRISSFSSFFLLLAYSSNHFCAQ